MAALTYCSERTSYRQADVVTSAVVWCTSILAARPDLNRLPKLAQQGFNVAQADVDLGAAASDQVSRGGLDLAVNKGHSTKDARLPTGLRDLKHGLASSGDGRRAQTLACCS